MEKSNFIITLIIVVLISLCIAGVHSVRTSNKTGKYINNVCTLLDVPDCIKCCIAEKSNYYGITVEQCYDKCIAYDAMK